MKGQTTIIAIVLILIVFLVLFLFITSTFQNSGAGSRLNFYTNGLLLSLLKTDTQYLENPKYCETMSDLIWCASTTPTQFYCGEDPCGEAAERLIDLYVSSVIKEDGYSYYMEFGDIKLGDPKVKESDFKEKVTQVIEKDGIQKTVTLYITKL